MKIPEELLKKWLDLRSAGDGRKIQEASPDVSPMDASRAFARGECSDEVFEGMAKFYKEKATKLKEYLQDESMDQKRAS